MRKAHELWAAARVEVCKNHVAGSQFEAQRSATANTEPDESPGHARDNCGEGIPRNAPGAGGPGGSSDGADGTRGEDGTGDRDDHSDNADRRTRQRLANEPAPADDATASSPGSSRSSPPVAPAPVSSSHMTASAAALAARSPAHSHETAHMDDNNASGVLAPSGASTGTDGSDASGVPAPSGAGPGAQ